jgi:hypothetical protein
MAALSSAAKFREETSKKQESGRAALLRNGLYAAGHSYASNILHRSIAAGGLVGRPITVAARNTSGCAAATHPVATRCNTAI